MFRFVSTNALQSLRPVLLQNLKNNSGIIVQQPSSFQNGFGLNSNFQRFNSYTGAIKTKSGTTEPLGDYVEKLKEDPIVGQAIRDEAQIKLNYFKEQVTLLNQYRQLNDREGKQAFSDTVHNILDSFEDSELRSVFTTHDLKRYVNALNSSIYHNRTNRLTRSKNLDKDQYSSSTAVDENILRNALLRLNEILMNGELKNILNVDSLHLFFNAMNQFQFYEACVDVWEQGVNDPQIGSMFLSDKILAIVLPIAFKVNRFSYEEISRIFELNTDKSKSIDPLLLCSMGKISISAGDYSRGLDILETLLKHFENRNENDKGLYLGDLHLAFIGNCADINISRHFFDKVINFDLPYPVKLKVPYTQALLENCQKSNEPFEVITYFWKKSVGHYKKDTRFREMNSRYSILNNTYFKIFFESFPELNAESFGKLKDIISTYNEVKGIDEVFLNTLVTNYSWKDKDVFHQILENYNIFNIDRTQVSYRVSLKKIGELKDFSEGEILQKWNESLESLDNKRFTYIPIADWASLRDATIWAQENKQERSELYWKIVNKYKNYFQDQSNCYRFIKNWFKNDNCYENLKDKAVSGDSDVVVPHFRNLKESVNFNKIFANLENQRKHK